MLGKIKIEARVEKHDEGQKELSSWQSEGDVKYQSRKC